MRKIPCPLLPTWVRWTGVLVAAGAVFYLSVVTAPPEQPVVSQPDLVPLDKWRHFLAYAGVGGSLAYATTDWDWSVTRLLPLVVVVTVCYGVGLELWQGMLPERYFSMGDAYANAIGAVLVLPWFAIRDRLRYVELP